jgi:hypothetical protein
MAAKELAADYPRQRVRGHAAAFEQAFAPAGPNGRSAKAARPPGAAALRGLAPGMRLASLLEPPSAWGRTPLGPV